MSSHLTCIAAPSDSMHVQDFVKLAKWEDRGYYAQQQATEKAQRQLLKLVTGSEAVLAMPAGPLLAAAAAAASQPQEPASNGAKGSHKAGAHPAPLTLDADEVGLACTWHPAVMLYDTCMVHKDQSKLACSLKCGASPCVSARLD